VNIFVVQHFVSGRCPENKYLVEFCMGPFHSILFNVYLSTLPLASISFSSFSSDIPTPHVFGRNDLHSLYWAPCKPAIHKRKLFCLVPSYCKCAFFQAFAYRLDCQEFKRMPALTLNSHWWNSKNWLLYLEDVTLALQERAAR